MSDNTPVNAQPIPTQQLDANALIEKAITSAVPVETMERLLAMRKEIMEEQARQAYSNAMANFQSDCPVIKKTKAVKNKNGSLRYYFAPMESIVEQVGGLLKANGLSVTFRTESRDNGVMAICEVQHIMGHKTESSFGVPIDPEAYMNDAQKAASALTFAKRYALMNALGIMTGDNDDDAQSLGVGPTEAELYQRFRLVMQSTMRHIDHVRAIKEALAAEDYYFVAQLLEELEEVLPKGGNGEPHPEMMALFSAPTKGGPFTVEEKKAIGEFVNPIISEMKKGDKDGQVQT